MTARVHRSTIPEAVGENRRRIRILEALTPPGLTLRPPQLMGNVGPTTSFSDTGTVKRLRSASVFRADADRPLLNGTELHIDYFNHVDGAFRELHARAHLATGLKLDNYWPRTPWLSDPWAGTTLALVGTGTTTNLTPIGGNWDGYFYMFAGLSSDTGDTVHFKSTTGEFDQDEIYGFDTPTGHLGYMFWNWTTSSAGNVEVSFATGFGNTGFGRSNRLTTGTIESTVLGTATAASNNFLFDPGHEMTLPLGADVPDGDSIILVIMGEDLVPNENTDGAMGRPSVWDGPDDVITEIPHYFAGGRWWPIPTGEEIQR